MGNTKISNAGIRCQEPNNAEGMEFHIRGSVHGKNILIYVQQDHRRVGTLFQLFHDSGR